MVEVQKLRTFYDFCWPRATLCGDSRGRGSKTEDFLRFLLAARDPLRRSCASKRSRCGAVRICLSLGEPSAEIVRVEALSLWRCSEHLRRATCAEQAQSNLHRPTCAEHMRKALVRSNWRRALAQSNLLRALAQSNLHRALARSSFQRATCAQQPGTMQLAQTTFVRNRAAQFERKVG